MNLATSKIISHAAFCLILGIAALISNTSYAKGNSHNWHTNLVEILEQQYYFADNYPTMISDLDAAFADTKNTKLKPSAKQITNVIRKLTHDNNIEVSENNAAFELTTSLTNPEQLNTHIAVTFNHGDAVAEIAINHIYNNAAAQQRLTKTLEQLPTSRAIILDFTDTQGDSLAFAQQLMSWFVTKHTPLFSISHQQGKSTQAFNSTSGLQKAKNRAFETTPVYILISSFTSGSAELIAFVLQKLDKAIVIGKPSMGNAVITREFSVSAELNVRLPIAVPFAATTQDNWQNSGVIPDINVGSDQALTTARATAKRFLDSQY